ncbi:unnamed protein product, partial [Iphiclides podalirius]
MGRLSDPFVFLTILAVTSRTGSDCTLSLKDDFGSPSPVFVKNGAFLTPNTRSGDISLQRSETLLVGCPGKNRFVVLGEDVTDFDAVTVQCAAGKVFRAGRWAGDFRGIRCSATPWFTVEPTNATCSGDHTLYRIGYRVNGEFYTLYRACFDERLFTTLYVQHVLSPEIEFYQRGGKRPTFIETGLFGKVRMSDVYARSNQRARINQLLGSGLDQRYITRNQFLTRGHLAPRADFTTRAMQRASFHYINAAPQWLRGNAGDWAALEDALRRRVTSSGRKMVVYTGTHGVSTLPDKHNQQQKLFLHVDENNNGVVPVPLYYYKLVYDPKELKAVAFVSINSSYYNKSMVDELTFCSDVCNGNGNYTWLKWRPRDGAHSFCCDYDEFVKEIDYLPTLTVREKYS